MLVWSIAVGFAPNEVSIDIFRAMQGAGMGAAIVGTIHLRSISLLTPQCPAFRSRYPRQLLPAFAGQVDRFCHLQRRCTSRRFHRGRSWWSVSHLTSSLSVQQSPDYSHPPASPNMPPSAGGQCFTSRRASRLSSCWEPSSSSQPTRSGTLR